VPEGLIVPPVPADARMVVAPPVNVAAIVWFACTFENV
jgi:hypothetical protein